MFVLVLAVAAAVAVAAHGLAFYICWKLAYGICFAIMGML